MCGQLVDAIAVFIRVMSDEPQDLTVLVPPDGAGKGGILQVAHATTRAAVDPKSDTVATRRLESSVLKRRIFLCVLEATRFVCGSPCHGTGDA